MKKACLTLTVFVVFILATHNTHGEESGMVLITAGDFNIGESTTTVHLKDYYIDKTEATQKDFNKVMGSANFFLKEKIIQQSR